MASKKQDVVIDMKAGVIRDKPDQATMAANKVTSLKVSSLSYLTHDTHSSNMLHLSPVERTRSGGGTFRRG